MRPDRLISLSLMLPLRYGRSAAGDFRLPILMYHSVSNHVEAGVSPYYQTVTTPKVFAEQMSLLHSEGYVVESLKKGMQALRRPVAAGCKMVVITFDDGFRDFYTGAFPILRRYGFGATMFLPTAFIGSERRSFKNRECLSWDDVCELNRAGIEFGSHTASHPQLDRLEPARINLELQDSKNAIEDQLGEAVVSFSYPYAFPEADREFVRGFRDHLRNAGYEFGVTTRIGRADSNDDRLVMKRLPVNLADDHALFKAKLEGAYDWMARPQTAFKHMRRLFRFWQVPSAGEPRQRCSPSVSFPDTRNKVTVRR